MSNIDTTLDERGKRYGEFDEHARVTQNIKDAMASGRNWCDLAPDQREALEMTAHKIGRILNGDPDYPDSWHDIAGYIRLVERRLMAQAAAKPEVKSKPMDDAAFVEAMRNLKPGMHVVYVSEETGDTD